MSTASSSEDNSEGDGGFPIYAIVSLGLVFGWLCCCCISTRGCTDCSYRDRTTYNLSPEDERVWGRPQQQRQQQREDRRLALQLQAQEDLEQQQQLTPEQQEAARQERERKIDLRTNFIRKNLESFPFAEEAGHGGDEEMKPGVEDPDGGSNKQCTICMEPFLTGQDVTQSNNSGSHCEHLFHYGCIVAWLVRKSHCPICRETFLQVDVKKAPKQQELQSVDNNYIEELQETRAAEASAAGQGEAYAPTETRRSNDEVAENV